LVYKAKEKAKILVNNVAGSLALLTS